jgi:D-aminoacyl-tRNA deacylase
MNIRENFLGDSLFKFKEVGTKWHEHPLFELEIVIAKRDWSPFFAENQIFIGLTDNPLIQFNDLKLEDTIINPDLLIFASRHRSEAARPAFLTHTTGNWGANADFGGNPYELCKTSAILLKASYISLQEQIYIKEMTNFSLDIEVTHHGPTTLEKPLIFMELGSREAEWEIEKAGQVVAHAILQTCLEYTETQKRKLPEIGIGFGGTHYAPQFKKLITLKNVAVSFICPKYYIQDLNKEMIQKMVSNNLELIDCFIIDWKGTNSADKQHLIPLLEEFDIPMKKTKEF